MSTLDEAFEFEEMLDALVGAGCRHVAMVDTSGIPIGFTMPGLGGKDVKVKVCWKCRVLYLPRPAPMTTPGGPSGDGGGSS